MRQRGRPSAVLKFPPVDAPRPQLVPPPSLTEQERTLFAELAAGASYLVATDAPLLASFCQATLLNLRLGRDVARVVEFEKAARVQTMLARALRLTPRGRVDPKTAGRRLQGAPTSYYDRDVSE